MVKDIFAEAHISGKTNHSLRASGTTQMEFQRRPFRSELVTRASMVLEYMNDLTAGSL